MANGIGNSVNAMTLADFGRLVRLKTDGQFATSIDKTAGNIYADKSGKVHNASHAITARKGDAAQNFALRQQLLKAFTDQHATADFLTAACKTLGLDGNIEEMQKPLSRRTVKQLLSDFNAAAYGMAPSYSFNVPGCEQPVVFGREALEGMINDLPEAERQGAVDGLQKTIQDRLVRGHQMLQSVLKMPGDVVLAPTAQDVADVTLFLQAKAESMGQGFESGAFSIEDPEGRLAKFLERSPDVYLRSSTHLKSFQNEQVDGHRNTQRGIDFGKGPQHGLLHSRRTVVFGTITPLESATGGAEDVAGGWVDVKKDVVAGRRLFLKPETHGCRISSRSFAAALSTSGKYRSDYGPDTVPRDWKASDIGTAIQHGLSLAGKRSERNARREALPRDFRARMNDFAQQHPELAERIGITYRKKGDPLGGAGIRAFLDGVERLSPADKADMPAELRSLVDDINARWLESPEKHKARLGDEVLLNISDLQS